MPVCVWVPKGDQAGVPTPREQGISQDSSACPAFWTITGRGRGLSWALREDTWLVPAQRAQAFPGHGGPITTEESTDSKKLEIGTCLPRHHVHSSSIHNSPKLETTQAFTKGRTDKQNVVHPHNGILSGPKREQSPDACRNRKEPPKPPAE